MSDTPTNETAPTVSDVEKIDVAQADTEVHINVFVQAFKDRDFELIQVWARNVVATREFWLDVGLIGATLLLALIFSRLFNRAFSAGKLTAFSALREKLPVRQQRFSSFRISLVLVSWLTLFVANVYGFPCPFLKTFTLIVTLFFLINLPARFIEWKSWMRVVSVLLFVIAGLKIFGQLDKITAVLDQNPLELGSLKITALDLFKGIISFFVLFWMAGFLSRLISDRIGRINDLSPHVKVLFRKGIRVGLYAAAVFLTLGIMGVKLTAFAVFGGAFGLGIGFGLQKVISNLVSGIILLLDKSVKPGDVIEIGNTYGWINSLNLRYASVITRDNKEHLIPNEDLITNPVINWTYSDKTIRVRSPFGISYESDIRLAMKLAEESAASTDRVIAKPPPRCNLVAFGDSSIDLELRFFIADPHNGVGFVRSEVLLNMWDAFRENGIEFPFPQRDVNLRIAGDSDLIEKIAESVDRKKDK